jgi:hypothetical protein
MRRRLSLLVAFPKKNRTKSSSRASRIPTCRHRSRPISHIPRATVATIAAAGQGRVVVVGETTIGPAAIRANAIEEAAGETETDHSRKTATAHPSKIARPSPLPHSRLRRPHAPQANRAPQPRPNSANPYTPPPLANSRQASPLAFARTLWYPRTGEGGHCSRRSPTNPN